MKIGLVQLESVKGDIEKNLNAHLEWIQKSAAAGTSLLIFPELSLTGYDSSMARDLAFDQSDSRLGIFAATSQSLGIDIAVGLPLATSDKPTIALLLFKMDGTRQAFTKQFLHEDEIPFFMAGEKKPGLLLNAEHIAFAICYEIFVDEHTVAVLENASIFIVSVAKSENGMLRANSKAERIAKEHDVSVLICNAIGAVEDYIADGGTAVWNRAGEKLAAIPSGKSGVLIWDSATNVTEIIN